MRLPCGRIIVGAVLLAMTPAVALAGEHSNPAHKSAFYVRALQTELMVAALTCQAKPEYKAFVTRFKKSLVRNGKALRGYYKLHYGAQSDQRLNTYVTQLANQTSQRTINARGVYCEQAKDLFSVVLATAPNLLEAVAAVRPAAKISLPADFRENIDVATSD